MTQSKSPGKSKHIWVINNQVAALFMSSWIRQNRAQLADAIHLVIYLKHKRWDGYSDNVGQKELFHEQSCQNFFSEFHVKWLNMEIDPEVRSARKISDFLSDRRNRHREFIQLKSALRAIDFDFENVSAIHFDNGTYCRYLFALCPKAKGYRYEHGLSDIRNSIDRRSVVQSTRLQRLKIPLAQLIVKARNLLRRFLLTYTDDLIRVNHHVSLLVEEIERARSVAKTKILSLRRESVIESALKTNELSNFSNSQVQQNSAFILMMYPLPKPWSDQDRQSVIQYYLDFEEAFLEMITRVSEMNNVSILYFKSKLFHEEYSAETTAKLEALRRKFEVVYLPEQSESNFPAEVYTALLKPKVLFASYSSTMLYVKKILPEVTTCSYDQWFHEYSQKHFNRHHPDFRWIRKLFHDQYGIAFSSVLPDYNF